MPRRPKRVLIVFPTEWDRRQLEACREQWEEGYEILFSEPTDEDCPAGLDILGWIDDTARETLADFATFEDGASVRYAVVNLGGPSRDELQRRVEAVVERLRFEMSPR